MRLIERMEESIISYKAISLDYMRPIEINVTKFKPYKIEVVLLPDILSRLHWLD